jgi:D-3-phosphoglycerate dehydrogenase/C-terminal binding protein
MRILFPDFHARGEPTIEREAAGPDVTIDLFRDGGTDEAWRQADAIVVTRMRIDATALARAPKCRIVVRSGVGFDVIDLAACGGRGIAVCNIPDYGTTEVADHAIAMFLTLARGTASYNEHLRADPVANWSYVAAPLVRRLRGATFGVVGLGRIGLAAARRAASFDMQVVFYDPHLPDGVELATGYRRAKSLEELLAQADGISCHTPLNDATRGMINERSLGHVKPGAILVNTSRGGVCDLAAVGEAIRAGKLGGAALDVVPQEPPPPDHPVIAAWRRREAWIDGRLILSPHAAFYSVPGQADLRRKAAETVVSYLRDGTLRNCVNLEYLAKRNA